MPPVHPDHTHAPASALRGGLLAVLAALLFGLSTPLIQRLGAGLPGRPAPDRFKKGSAWSRVHDGNRPI